ncbi:hypothetical protein [Silvanigrella aquatica]|uniref:Uncharacterized protein n=1 Tax=Silvanigrella aquatica TaxID=1915309 RepID=A0A1L4D2N9_9BACT|nr:hypothetical protein [Silvanigrella aquatica]APJ04475.1 hypothetical protein AXG55_11370 [Silvanigrella aquatica]
MNKIIRFFIPFSLLFSHAEIFPSPAVENASIQMQNQHSLQIKYNKIMKRLIKLQNQIARFGDRHQERLSDNNKVEIYTLLQALERNYYMLNRMGEAVSSPELQPFLRQALSSAEIEIKKSREFLNRHNALAN